MKIIYVKKIYILIIALLTVFGTFITFVSNDNKIIEVSSTPVTNKRIIIDAGHGLPDEGDCLLKSSKVPYIQYLNLKKRVLELKLVFL